MAPEADPSRGPLTVGQLLGRATAALGAAGVATPRLDAEVLLATACGIDRTGLYARHTQVVRPACERGFRALLTRRLAREPLHYIIGRREFWSLDFLVTRAVLTPRPETELLLELALQRIAVERAADGARLCDLGTGSGCIAVALACEFPGAEIWALDRSVPALAVAAANARRHGLAAAVRCVESDLFAAVPGVRFDAILCNPPYVSTDVLDGLQPELRWEPRQALDGGERGLAVIRRVLAAAPEHLIEGGWLVLEMGAEQGPAVAALARRAGFDAISLHADYAGLTRALVARRPVWTA